MKQLTGSIRRMTIGVVVLMLFFFPVGTFAEGSTDPAPAPEATSSESDSQVVASAQGPTVPPGPERKSYHYNESTGLWENDHYTWNPNTGETKSKDPTGPTYNPETKTWDTTKWQYDAPSGKYVPRVTSVPAPAPQATAGSQADGTSSNVQSSTPQASAVAMAGDTVAAAQAGNNVQSLARSGNAAVSYNTTGGNALSGNAQSMTNVLNALQSSWGAPGNGDIATFTADINGSVVGDLLIDPSSFSGSVLPASGPTPSDLDVNIAASGTIDNTIVAGAISGNATVNHNTSAGNATSGAATAMANVINLINATIAAGQSFIGTININGDFEGDILLPQELKALLASGDVPTATIAADSRLVAEFNNTQSITNNVSLAAQSGAASVSGNTSAGNASTGRATTNLTVFNLTGRQIVGGSALLVFVNVLGEWVGMIVDAPAGSTAALLSGGITGSNALATVGDTMANVTNNSRINNNITAYATSGDAVVEQNTQGGNATTGDAKASVNIANITASQLSLADWFGILFINVFGKWHGSFGVDTPMGNTPVAVQPNDPAATPSVTDVRVFQFVSGGGSKLKPAALNNQFKAVLASHQHNDAQANGPQILGATSVKSAGQEASTATKRPFNFWIVLVTLFIAGLLLTTERLLDRKKQRIN